MSDQRSSTPADKVANVAADVADTAHDLDGPGLEHAASPEHHDPKTPLFSHEDLGPYEPTSPMKEEDPRTRLFSHEDLGPYEPISPVKEDPRTRLFSHESLGAYEPLDDDVYNQGAEEAVVDVPPKQRTRSTPSPPSSGDSYYVDPNDPTIETFPCDRKSVMSTLRKIQSSSASTTSGHLLSAQDTTQTPRFSDPRIRRLSGDSNPDDGSNYSTEPVSPKTIPFPRRRDSRASHSSLDKASTSLGAIAED